MKIQYIKEGVFKSYDDVRKEREEGEKNSDRVSKNTVKRAKKAMLDDVTVKLRNEMIDVLTKVNKGTGTGRPSVTMGILPMVFRNRAVGKDRGTSEAEMKKYMIVDTEDSGDVVNVVLRCIVNVNYTEDIGQLRLEESTIKKISRALKDFETKARSIVAGSGVYKDMSMSLRIENKEDLNNVQVIFYDLLDGYYMNYFLNKFEEGSFDILMKNPKLEMQIGRTSFKYNYHTGTGDWGRVGLSLACIKELYPKIVTLPKEHSFNYVYDDTGKWVAQADLHKHPAYISLTGYGPQAKEFRMTFTYWLTDAIESLRATEDKDVKKSYKPVEDALKEITRHYHVKLSAVARKSAIDADKRLRTSALAPTPGDDNLHSVISANLQRLKGSRVRMGLTIKQGALELTWLSM